MVARWSPLVETVAEEGRGAAAVERERRR
jgi:hypothetical protein